MMANWLRIVQCHPIAIAYRSKFAIIEIWRSSNNGDPNLDLPVIRVSLLL